MKHLAINLTKEVMGLYTENYKTLLKETVRTGLWTWGDGRG